MQGETDKRAHITESAESQSRERKGGYLYVPDSIQQNTGLSATAKDILGAIGRRMGRGGTCTMTREEIRFLIGAKSLDSVDRAIAILERKDELKCLRRTHTTLEGTTVHLPSIYSAKWAVSRNIRWKFFDLARQREIDLAEQRGKLTRIPSRKMRPPLAAKCGLNTYNTYEESGAVPSPGEKKDL